MKAMQKFLSVLLAVTLLCAACPAARAEEAADGTPDFQGLNDPALLPYLEDTLYQELVSALDSEDYFVENVSAVYISQEYLDELAYNSQANIFFGYTLDELNAQFQGEKFVFTLGDHDETVVQPFEAYDDTMNRIIRNVAVGTGVILICVTVSVVTAGAGAPAVSMIFATAAKTGAVMGLKGALFGGVSAGIVTGLETGDFDAALKAGAVGASEGFKWGAISGSIAGGVSEASALKGATVKGLSMNEAAAIQKDSGSPLDVIKEFKTMDQYNICKEAGLTPRMVNGHAALVREIDLDFVDDFGRTNLERMQQGLAALDPSGQAYELHHIGQEMDSTLAILTKAEHMQGGNDLIWHELGEASKINRRVFDKQRAEFWKTVANLLTGGVI